MARAKRPSPVPPEQMDIGIDAHEIQNPIGVPIGREHLRGCAAHPVILPVGEASIAVAVKGADPLAGGHRQVRNSVSVEIPDEDVGDLDASLEPDFRAEGAIAMAQTNDDPVLMAIG